jgi:MoaA/NifB/PqqE/SkfB family radical SAM enzyme
MVDLALALGASRIEIAHVQYYGWALRNRAALMPSRAQVERAAAALAELRSRHHGRIVIDAVIPDYYARYPKPCVGGWGRRSLNVTPVGKVPATRPNRFPDLNSGTCASMRSPISGRTRRPSILSAAPRG